MKAKKTMAVVVAQRAVLVRAAGPVRAKVAAPKQQPKPLRRLTCCGEAKTTSQVAGPYNTQSVAVIGDLKPSRQSLIRSTTKEKKEASPVL
jgi:hypothetical protein